MNKIYKVVWNANVQCFQAVSELGKGGKAQSSKVATEETLDKTITSLPPPRFRVI